MFFPRLRRRAKWVFAFLALAFALAFLVAGVGSGFGSGFGDYLSDLFNRQPGTDTPSVDAARERVEKNPKDADAQKDLGTALQTEGRTEEAIAAFEAYTKLRPEDTDGLQTLASLYAGHAARAEQRAVAARTEGARAFFGAEIVNPESKFTEELGVDPITTFTREQASTAFNEAAAEAQEIHRKEADVWERLTKLEPEEPSFFAELGRSAEAASDFARAVTAYERYLELSPDDPNAPQYRERIKALKQAQQTQSPIVQP